MKQKADQMMACVKQFTILRFLPTLLISIPAYLLVAYALTTSLHPVLAILAYVYSAYALVLTTTLSVRWIRRITEIIRQNPLYQRYRQDVVFRTKITLGGGITVNAAFILLKLVTGIQSRSYWLIFLAIYYTLLTLMKAALFGYLLRRKIGAHLEDEYKRYRRTGIFLLIFNQLLTVLAVWVVKYNRGYEYPGFFVFGMAAYTFYILIIAIVNLVRYRKYQSPVLSAIKAINLSTALVALFALETALIDRFGASDDSGFRQIMTSFTATVVCLLVLGIAVYMIVRSSRQLQAFKERHS